MIRRNIWINNHEFMAVLDTGAGASVIQEKVATKLKLRRFTIKNALIEFGNEEEEKV